MWNFTSLSANYWFSAFTLLAIFGAGIALIGSIGAFKMGAIKEQLADERTAANEAQTARSLAEAEVAKADAAKANAEAMRLTVELERLRHATEGRSFTTEQSIKLTDELKRLRIEHPASISLFYFDLLESKTYAQMLDRLFRDAGYGGTSGPGVTLMPLNERTPERYGVYIDNRPEGDAQAFFSAFQRVGIAPHLFETNRNNRYSGTAMVIIEVWPKPMFQP